MADGLHQHFSPSMVESLLTSSPSVLVRQRSPKSQTPDSNASLVSIQTSSSMLAEALVRQSQGLVQSEQKMTNIPKCNGSAGNSVLGKKTRRSQQSDSEAPSSEQQALHTRRSPRLVGSVKSGIGNIVNSAAKNGLTGKTKMQQQGLHLSSSKRLRSSTKQNGLAETSPATKKKKNGKGSSSNREDSFFIGDPVPDDEARVRWPWRYEEKKVHSKITRYYINIITICVLSLETRF